MIIKEPHDGLHNPWIRDPGYIFGGVVGGGIGWGVDSPWKIPIPRLMLSNIVLFSLPLLMAEIRLISFMVNIPLFRTGFSTIPGGCLRFQPSTVFGEDFQFDLLIFFRWAVQPPTKSRLFRDWTSRRNSRNRSARGYKVGRWVSWDFFVSLGVWVWTWRIIPVSKWLGSPPFISHKKAIWKGSHNPILRGFTNHGY